MQPYVAPYPGAGQPGGAGQHGFCMKCGRPKGDDGSFCMYCGAPQAPAPVATVATAAATTVNSMDTGGWSGPYRKITAHELEGCYVCMCFPLVLFYCAPGRNSRTSAPR